MVFIQNAQYFVQLRLQPNNQLLRLQLKIDLFGGAGAVL